MKNKRWIWSLVLAIVIIAVVITFDLLSKHFAEKGLVSEGNSANFIPGFINFYLLYNNGGGWNIFAGQIVFLVIFSVLVIAALTVFYVLRLKKHKTSASLTFAISYGLIFGGFFGNLFDRLAFGHVRDFLNFQFMNFPVFNVADICLCVGMVLLAIYFIFIFDKEGKKNDKLKEQK